MRKATFGLVFFLLIACSGSSTPGDPGAGSLGASGGEDASSGGSGHGESGGSSGTSGATMGGVATGGSSSGGANQGGSELGGTTSGGADAGEGTGDSGGVGGTAGITAGSAGTVSPGTGGTAGRASTDPVCDPPDGELDNTPYPSCEPRALDDPCELCIEASCCEESKVCYGFDPGNVCGWGGPSAGGYDRLSEIDCYLACVRDYVSVNGVYDDDAADLCVPACTTTECGLIGNATQDLVVCLEAHCDGECFGP